MAVVRGPERLLYAYYDTAGQGFRQEYLSKYRESLLFDAYNRTLYAYDAIIGNHQRGTYHGEIFNDFVRNQAPGRYSHAEGYNTYAFGTGAHAQGDSARAVGDAAFATGTNTETKNSSETGIGFNNKSYTGVTGSRLMYCDVEKPSGESLFTIGNGDSTAARRNVMTVHKNGDLVKPEGVSYFIADVYAPLTYSYVSQLGMSAYLGVVLSALLENPKYIRPTVGVKFVGHNANNYYTTSQTTTITWANPINLSVGFRAAYVCPNYDDRDVEYSKDLGNRLGYSTAVTTIRYRIATDASSKNAGTEVTREYYKTHPYDNTYIESVNNVGTRKGVTTGGLTYIQPLKKDQENDLGMFSGRIFTVQNGAMKYNDEATQKDYVVNSHVYGDSENYVHNASFVPLQEGTFTVFELLSYDFAASTQMYFQQLANKNTYIPNDGLAPTDKFGVTSYVSGALTSWKVNVVQRYYYGTTTKANIESDSFNITSGSSGAFNLQQFQNASNHSPISGTGVLAEEKTITWAVNASEAIWVAVPTDGFTATGTTADMETEQARTDDTTRTWASTNNAMCAARAIKGSLDSYFSIQTQAANQTIDNGIYGNMPIRKKTTKTKVNGLYYDIYYVAGLNKVPNGTATVKIKRVW